MSSTKATSSPNGQRSSPTKGSVLTTTFLQIRRRLQVISANILGNEAEAEDALSEAFLRLWKHPQCEESPQQAEAMLTTTVRNLCIDEVRKRRTHPTDSLDELSQEVGDTSHNTDDDETELRLQRVEKLIAAQLSPQQQRILRMRDVENHSYAHIASQLQMQETAVRMQLSRARKLIRELYRQQYQD